MGMLAAHIKSLRKNAGLTQKQLGMRIGVGATTINNIESGYLTAPSMKIVDALAEAFNTDSYSLLNRISLDVGERAKMIHVVSSVSSRKPFIEVEKIVETAFIDREELHGFEYMGIRMPDKAMIEEAIKEGSTVIVRKDTVFKNGDIVAAGYNDTDAVIRMFYREGDIIRLKAANSSGLYPDIIIDEKKDKFVPVGKVIHWTNYADKK